MVNLDLWFVIVTFDQSSNHQFERWFCMTIDMTTWKLFKGNDHGRSWSLHHQGHYVCTLLHHKIMFRFFGQYKYTIFIYIMNQFRFFGQYKYTNYIIFNWFGTHHPVLLPFFPSGDPCTEWDLRAGSNPQGDGRGLPRGSSAVEATGALGVLCHSSAHQDAVTQPGGWESLGMHRMDGELEVWRKHWQKCGRSALNIIELVTVHTGWLLERDVV